MRDLNGVKIIAVDNGYGNTKTANTVTPTGLAVSDTEPIFSGNLLEYDGKFYRVGEGHKPFVADKAADGDTYVLTLMAVAKELNIAGIREADVHLAAGLPMTWIRRILLCDTTEICYFQNFCGFDFMCAIKVIPRRGRSQMRRRSTGCSGDCARGRPARFPAMARTSRCRLRIPAG